MKRLLYVVMAIALLTLMVPYGLLGQYRANAKELQLQDQNLNAKNTTSKADNKNNQSFNVYMQSDDGDFDKKNIPEGWKAERSQLYTKAFEEGTPYLEIYKEWEGYEPKSYYYNEDAQFKCWIPDNDSTEVTQDTFFTAQYTKSIIIMAPTSDTVDGQYTTIPEGWTDRLWGLYGKLFDTGTKYDKITSEWKGHEPISTSTEKFYDFDKWIPDDVQDTEVYRNAIFLAQYKESSPKTSLVFNAARNFSFDFQLIDYTGIEEMIDETNLTFYKDPYVDLHNLIYEAENTYYYAEGGNLFYKWINDNGSEVLGSVSPNTSENLIATWTVNGQSVSANETPFSQENYIFTFGTTKAATLDGKVTTESKEPASFAFVIYESGLQENGTYYKASTLTDENGNYSIKVPLNQKDGHLTIMVDGHKQVVINVDPTDESQRHHDITVEVAQGNVKLIGAEGHDNYYEYIIEGDEESERWEESLEYNNVLLTTEFSISENGTIDIISPDEEFRGFVEINPKPINGYRFVNYTINGLEWEPGDYTLSSFINENETVTLIANYELTSPWDCADVFLDGSEGHTDFTVTITKAGEDPITQNQESLLLENLYLGSSFLIDKKGVVTAYYYNLETEGTIVISPNAQEGMQFLNYTYNNGKVLDTDKIYTIEDIVEAYDIVFITANYDKIPDPKPDPEPGPKPRPKPGPTPEPQPDITPSSDQAAQAQAGKSAQTNDTVPFEAIAILTITLICAAGFVTRKYLIKK